MQIKIFSDMVCPFCYVGKLRLDQAIAQAGLKNVDIKFKAFQLHPSSPADHSMPIYEFISKAYGPGAVGNPAMRAQIQSSGKSVGVDFRYDIMRSCNTKKAHRLCKWADKYGKMSEMTLAVMDGYFSKGKELNHNEDLLEMVKNVGLNTKEAEEVLNSEEYLKDVDYDIIEAYGRGVHSVPYFIFNDKVTLSGAQPVEVFVETLKQVAKAEENK